ncbi:hypothetical protein GCM10009676_44350 [Prauserella halophila]|uniref:Glycosyltransferase RgtA/B/C/D-like domain-containing protein n=1 Tax=Prauserella halophila TaxID=185641 RepID=A0ABN1WJL4_9PSEU|nr:hypothetical protein [Prauserella halophila]MCP2237698.1 hypothetical protein [Prauserella halophila]
MAGRQRTAVVVGLSAVGGLLAFLLVRTSLTDDAYITLTYARNLAEHGEWGIIPGAASNSATSPLNVLLLALGAVVTRWFGDAQPIVALGFVTVGATAALGWAWTRMSVRLRFPAPVALLGVAVVVVNPFVLSAIGLEVLLIPAVVAGLVAATVERRPVWFGVVAGLAVLVRLDLVVFVVTMFAVAMVRAFGRRWWQALAAMIVVALPWYALSWVTFGSAVPDTLVVKQSQDGLFGPWSYATGIGMYLEGVGVPVLLALVPAALGVIALLAAVIVRFVVVDRPALGAVAGLGAGGVAHYVVYVLLGVGPYHWYYVPPLTALAMCAVLALGSWWGHRRGGSGAGPDRRKRPLVAVGLFGAITALVLVTASTEVQRGVPWRSPPIFGNWANAEDYARVGTELGRRVGDVPVRSPGEIGTLAYFCECRIVDPFSDRGRVPELLEARLAEAGPIGSALLEANYLWFDRDREPLDPGYRLLYSPGPGPGPGHGPHTWTVRSDARGIGHFTLVRIR